MSTKCALHDSVSPFNRHLVVFTATADWVERLEKEDGTFFALVSKQSKALASELKLKVTAAHASTHGDCQLGMLYPEQLQVVIPSGADDMLAFITGLYDDKLSEDFLGRFKSPSPPSFERLVLVCVHGARDKRCGKAGPRVLEAIQKECSARRLDSTLVCGSSHIGGHKYAATLISYPGGDWFGQVTPKKVPQLVEFIVSGQLEMVQPGGELNTSFRGRSFDW